MFEPITDYDFRIYSDDRKSYITFTLEQYIHNRLPSLSCTIDVIDNKFSGRNVDVWFSIDELIQFINHVEIGKVSKKCSLQAMSPDEFTISVERINRRGDFVVTYSLSTSRYTSNGQINSNLAGEFHFNQEFIISTIQDLKRFSSVTKLQADADFRLN
ncbi:WapI family immunity protein [Paenibacillus sp. NRS-1760]|uniref:WapI family immunity protein n=1 Tax=Paenibacillus sp. NRS-1760 TaxID=3233902 RepID=UPI003D2B5233